MRHSSRGARMLTATLLAGALALGGPTVWATDDDPEGGAGGSTGDSATSGGGGLPGSATAVPVPRGAGFGTNGSAAGDAPFTPLPADAAYPVPEPPVNEDLPTEIDATTAFAPQVTCDPESRPGVIAFALLVSEHYDRPTFSGARQCIDYMSFHHDGRALDWPLNAYDAQDRRIGDAVVAWLTADDAEMMRRFGMEYIIWNGLIFQKEDNRWRYYTGTPHEDHIHISFTWDGAMMRTSWWTGVAVTQPDLGPCDTVARQYAALHTFPRLDICETPAQAAPQSGLGRVRPGESGGGVTMLQGVLGVEESGVLDQATRDALIAWQEEQGIPATGVADDYTYAAAQGWEVPELPEEALAVQPKEWQVTAFTPYKRRTLTEGDDGEAVVVLQEAIGAEPDGAFGPKTAAALLEWEETVPVLAEQAVRRGDGPAVVTPLTWVFLERSVHPTIALRDIELAEGSLDIDADPEGRLAARASAEGAADSPYAGGAVSALQELLGVDVDGSFGPQTAEAVREVQEAAELEPTGEVDGPTWAAVEELAIEEGRVAGAPGLEAQQAREEAEEAEKQAQAEEEQARAEHEAAVASADR